jgi:hypothetical protein
MTDIINILKQDYAQFPKHQHFDIYADDVYFKDPLNEFYGCDRYREMIGFIDRWFTNPQLDLHAIQQNGNDIRTDWTLSWTTPLPWQPRISIDGWSELKLGDHNLIISHIDYWHCSRFEVVMQHLWPRTRHNGD